MRLSLVALLGICSADAYTAKVVSFDPKPVISYVDGNSEFTFAFNPSWIVAGASQPHAGILVRTQNCTGCGTTYNPKKDPNKGCCHCAGTGEAASIMTFAKLIDGDGSSVTHPKFEPLTADSVVFGPHNDSDLRGTEDPRVAYDSKTGTYYMMYTCWSKAGKGQLCLATTKDPTSKADWTRHGPIFPGDHKSGAIIVRDSPPHYLISGAGQIYISTTDDLLKWTLGDIFINQTAFGNPHVEAGPPPMKLSDGNYVFFYNSWGGKGVPPPGYQPVWAILDGKDPSKILAQAPGPLWTPTDQTWMQGLSPYTCNVPQVSFLEAAHPVVDKADTFRVYFGGADAVIGTAVVSFSK